MTIQLSQKNYGLGLLFSVSIVSLLSLFLTETMNSGIIFWSFKAMLYVSFLFSILLLGQFFKTKAHILVVIFFVCSLIPILNYDKSSGPMIGERFRWMFYTVAILSANIENVRFWIKILIGMMLLYCVSPILFEPIFFPDSNVNTGWDFEIERFSSVLITGGLFLFGIQQRLSKKQKIILYCSSLLALFFLVFYARRTASLYIMLFIFAPIFSSVERFSSKLKIGILSILLLFSLGYLVIDNMGAKFYEKLSERINEDSRSGVDLLAIDAIENGGGWITGIGLHGGYFNPIEHEPSDTRSYVETGVLDVIMDGGLLLWLSMMVLSIYAFYLGQFKSKNSLIKCFSYVVLIFIIMQYPLPQPGFDMKGFMIFSAIGFCLNKEYREYSDDEIFERIE